MFPRPHEFITLGALFAFMSLLLPSHAQFKDVSNEWGYSGGGKAAFADYNGDGFIDLFASKLWRNEKGEKFVDAKDSEAPGGEVIWGDFDVKVRYNFIIKIPPNEMTSKSHEKMLRH